MNKYQAAFEIVYIISGIDGKIDSREMDVLLNFLEANLNELDFDPTELSKDLDLLNKDGVIEEFTRASLVYNQLTDAREKRILMDLVLETICVDGVLNEMEICLLIILGNNLNIDIDKYLN